MAIDRQLVIDCFVAETDEALAHIEEVFVALEHGALDADSIQSVFRCVHTLKGNAASLDFPALSAFAHEVEDALEPLRSGNTEPRAELISALLGVVDALRQATQAVVAGGQISGTQLRAVEKVVEAINGAEHARVDGTEPEAKAEPTSHHEPTNARTLRVPIEKLDRMLNLVGEIGVAKARLRMAVMAGNSREMSLLVVEEIERLYMQLQEQVMDARMVPIGPTFRRFMRMVRDSAAQHGKRVDLVIEGEAVGVDTALVECIRDPLMHMLRNAVDHGIETPEARRLAGKNERGKITLRASHQAGTILIEIVDDGAGLDKAKIRDRAVKLGLMSEGERLTPAAAAELIFHPGFTTSMTVTETSGRGVGMDVVRRNVQALHGTVEITSEEGKGTAVCVRLPLTLAVLEAFAVRVGTDMFLLPLDAVVECLDSKAVSASQYTALIDVRGEMVPAVRLASLFRCTSSGNETAVLLRHNGTMAAVMVDELLGAQQAVIKPLGNMFRKVPGVSGSTIIGDGSIALVLDVAGLLREAVRAEASVRVH